MSAQKLSMLKTHILYERPETEHAQNTTSYALKLQVRLEKVHHFARQRLQMMSDRMKRHYDNQLVRSKLQVGTAVWLYNSHRQKGITPKLMRKVRTLCGYQMHK